MTQHMPLGILRARAAEMRAQSPIDPGRFLGRITLYRDTPDQEEAAPGQQFVAHAVEDRAQCRQRKFALADFHDRFGEGLAHGVVQFGDLRL